MKQTGTVKYHQAIVCLKQASSTSLQSIGLALLQQRPCQAGPCKARAGGRVELQYSLLCCHQQIESIPYFYFSLPKHATAALFCPTICCYEFLPYVGSHYHVT
jgi:hypothetical protein